MPLPKGWTVDGAAPDNLPKGWTVDAPTTKGDIFDQVPTTGGTFFDPSNPPRGDVFDQVKLQNEGNNAKPLSPAYADVSFGSPTPTPPIDTRKISYTDPGFTQNKPASQYTDADFKDTGAAAIPVSPKVKGFVKNFAQDLWELPQFPVKMAESIINAPDTLSAVGHTLKSMVTTPLGFIPGMSDYATGKPASENWETTPGVGAMLAFPALKGGKALIEGAASKAVDMVTPTPIESFVRNGMEKGVRPSVQGNRTFRQSQDYMNRAADAVKSIVESKDKLNLTDDYGEPITTLPQNLKQFSQAISQTKQHIYDKYNALAEQAGEQAATVPLDSAVAELTDFANLKHIQDLTPEAASYAEKLAKSLSDRATYTPAEAQSAIKILNNSLEGFYKNPSYETASRASIDAMVANHLRKSLDTVIDNSTGEAYQPLKNQYGALKHIERDVNQRAIVEARKNNKGLIDFTDILTGAELAHGLLSGNPALIGKAIAGRGVKEYIKQLNSPNRAVRKMFEGVDRSLNRELKRGLSEDVRPIEPGTPPMTFRQRNGLK